MDRAWPAVLALGVALSACTSIVDFGFPDDSDGPAGTPSPTPTTPDPGFGDGHDGALTVTTSLAPNLCHPLVYTSGATVLLSLGAPPFPDGAAVLLHQAQAAFAELGGPDMLDAAGTAGTWELARVVGSTTGRLTLASAPAQSFRSDTLGRAQVCTVPEYTDVTIAAAGRLFAKPWDGSSGGVLVFLATGSVTVTGALDASGAGFRGGPASEPGGGASTDALGTSPSDGGAKGEGLDAQAWTRSGRGRMANAAGGGNSTRGGGGGGGSAGLGGAGGRDATDAPDSGGMGGSAVSVSGRILLGGGGGGGHQDSSPDELGGFGGAGGGAVVVFAGGGISGSGSILADGALGGAGGSDLVPDSADGAGGGGAGGLVWIRAGAASTLAGTLRANGGDGGDVRTGAGGNLAGPGGGGGGGRVRLENVSGAAGVAGGIAGVNRDVGAGNDPHGALAGAAGAVE